MPSLQSVNLGTDGQFDTITCDVTVNPGSNKVMVCAVHSERANSDVQPPTWGAQTFEQAPNGFAAATTWSAVEFWYLVDPDVGTNTVSVNIDGPSSADYHARIVVWVFDDCDQSNPLRTCFGSALDNDVEVSGFISGVIGTDYLIDALTIDSTGVTPVSEVNQSQEYNTIHNFGSHQLCGSSQSGELSDIMGWTWGSSRSFSYLATAIVDHIEPPQKLRPNADLSATGWSTAPLWSKIDEDSADGVFISGVAS